MKEKMKKVYAKLFVMGAGASLALTPKSADAASPSTYVNAVTGEVYKEAAAISLNLALVALIGFVIAYMTTGDDHKKAKIKWSGVGVVAALLVIGVLPSLVEWAKGLIPSSI